MTKVTVRTLRNHSVILVQGLMGDEGTTIIWLGFGVRILICKLDKMLIFCFSSWLELAKRSSNTSMTVRAKSMTVFEFKSRRQLEADLKHGSPPIKS